MIVTFLAVLLKGAFMLLEYAEEPVILYPAFW